MPKYSQLSFATIGAMSSYSGAKVWSGSTTHEPKTAPLSRRIATRLYHNARRFERSTRSLRKQDGAIGRNGLQILHALIFDLMEAGSGRLEPSYRTIAARACMSVSSVYRGLCKLKAAGVLNWVRRCAGEYVGKRFALVQETNSYAICPESQWKGYRSENAPPPAPGTWGDHAPMPDAMRAASELASEHAGALEIAATLELEPENNLAAALARMTRKRSQPGER